MLRALTLRRCGAVGLAWLLAASPAWAQSKRQEAFAPAFAEEEAGFADELAGRYREAVERFEASLEATLNASALDAEARGARVEFLSRRLNFLYGKADAYTRGWERFSKLAGDPRISALARDRAAYYAGEFALWRGDLDAAALKMAELGMVQGYYIIGPFENERGTGFGAVAAPELGLDLEAAVPGKERPVRWRPVPLERLPQGAVNLDVLLRPNEQCLAYALTYVKASAVTPVALRLGSDEAVKVFVNGKERLAHDRRRSLGFDQSVVGVTLAEGWNAILIKVADQTGDWGFRMRITSPQGGPVEGLTMAATAEIPELAAAHGHCVGSSIEGEVAVSLGAFDTYAAWREADPKDAALAMRLGYLVYARGAEDQGAHADRALFKEACDLDPKSSLYQLLYSITAAASGEFSVNREENARRQALVKALELDPQNAEAAQSLAGYYLNSMGMKEAARRYVAAALAVNPRYEDAVRLQAQLDAMDGLSALAERRLDALNLDSIAELRRRAAQAAELRKVDRALEILDAALALAPGQISLLQERAEVLRRSVRYEAAAQALSRVLELDPWALSTWDELSNLCLARGDLSGAVAALDAALVIAPEDAERLWRAAVLLRRTGDLDATSRMVDRLLAVSPNDPQAKRYARYLSEEKPEAFEAGWIIDPAEVAADAAAVPIDGELSYRILLRNVVTRVGASGLPSRFEQRLFRIENEQGVRAFRSVGEPFFVGDERVEMRTVRVRRKDGRVEEVPGSESYDWGRGEFGRYSSVVVALPPLEVGDIVEVRSRKDTLRHGFFGDFFQSTEAFEEDVPIRRVRVAYLLPKGRPFYFQTHGAAPVPSREERGDELVTVYEARDLGRIKSEPYMPWDKEVQGRVCVSSFQDWNAFARWYWALVKDQHESNAEIAALVKELTKDAETEEQKIQRVYEYVVSEIRYNAAWEFGIHGFKPYNATSIYARKFGDCKDKSTLINTMLRELGIESYPVLIFGAQWPGDARGEEDIALPLISHFNHCISYVMPGGERAGRFLDGTAQHHPFGTLPSMDYGARVVVVTPEGAIVKTIPMPGASENRVRESARVIVEADGEAVIEQVIEAKGSFGVVLRGELENEARRKEVVERILSRRLSGATVSKVETSDLESLETPVQVKVELKLEKAFQEGADGLTLVPIKSWLFDILSPELSDLAGKVERDHALILPNPRELEERLVVELPSGMELIATPEPVRLETEFGVYERRVRVEGGKVIIERQLKLEARRISKEQYEAFRDWVTRVEQARADRIRLRKSEVVPQ